MSKGLKGKGTTVDPEECKGWGANSPSQVQ